MHYRMGYIVRSCFKEKWVEGMRKRRKKERGEGGKREGKEGEEGKSKPQAERCFTKTVTQNI